jgi:hypothetical protein
MVMADDENSAFAVRILTQTLCNPAWLEPATLVTKLRFACARFGGQRIGLVLR